MILFSANEPREKQAAREVAIDQFCDANRSNEVIVPALLNCDNGQRLISGVS